MVNSDTHEPIDPALVGAFDALRRAFQRQGAPNLTERRDQLKRLRSQLQRYQNSIATAIAADFGQRAPTESKIIDVLGLVLDINHVLSQLKGWMKPARRSTELLFKTNHLHVRYEPKGVVGIISPWNFPLYLSLGPLVTALAAGNRAMIKMPAQCVQTTALLQQMLGEVFDSERVCVIAGDQPGAHDISRLPFDQIVFTGSPAVGRTIMRNAAANLTPVLLELGGKSPAVVARDYPISDAALRLVHGKIINAGQICVSPDYALIHKSQRDEFIVAAKAAFARLRRGSGESADYTAIVNQRQNQRFLALLDDARAQGAEVIALGEVDAEYQHPVYLVLNPGPDMRVTQEEIFGPILPVHTYDQLSDAVALINANPHPLALYLFSHKEETRDYLLSKTTSGGVSINDWGWHAFNHSVPFGGIGESGMGSYHGEEGFRALSHARPVFSRHRFFPSHWFYPPYETLFQKLCLRLFLGKADPDATLKPGRAERQEMSVDEQIPESS